MLAFRAKAFFVTAFLFSLLPCVAQNSEAPSQSPKPETGNRIEVRGQGLSDEDQRRFSTAAKIVIGREQIEQFGDSNVSEVLRRLPGITLGGAPGRG
ncbi:MAG: hypothetical protein EB121_05040, partial [Alphaproteobacteria bacterium]|nr:hypothetical protein [Alphaproteobacteria bacterium]